MRIPAFYPSPFTTAAVLLVALHVAEASPIFPDETLPCRVLPGDPEWPNQDAWDALNDTVGGRLIKGTPLAKPCYAPDVDTATCDRIRDEWTHLSPL